MQGTRHPSRVDSPNEHEPFQRQGNVLVETQINCFFEEEQPRGIHQQSTSPHPKTVGESNAQLSGNTVTLASGSVVAVLAEPRVATAPTGLAKTRRPGNQASAGIAGDAACKPVAQPPLRQLRGGNYRRRCRWKPLTSAVLLGLPLWRQEAVEREATMRWHRRWCGN